VQVVCPFCGGGVEVPCGTSRATCGSCGREFGVPNDPTAPPPGDSVTQSMTRPEEAEVAEEGTLIVAKGPSAPEGDLGWLREQFEGRYEIIEFIARGGMGAVYKARQLRPSRLVAIKIMLGGGHSQKLMRRFEREAHAAALLKHPSIVPIFEYGMVGGRPYFSMEYVEGTDLRTYVRQNRLNKREICWLFAQICRAVAYAHSQGVIHRDLKPGNVMIDSNGTPRILDFGLSRISNLFEECLTLSGDVVGTPRYMSPEQAAGKPWEIDERTDVYSLGVMFYELLVGTFPYDVIHAEGLGVLEVLRQAEPLRPSLLQSWMPKELEAVLMKALEKDKEQRYRSASSLARDIENFLADRPVSARPHTAMYRFRKFLWRNRKTVFPVAVMIVMFIVSSIAGYSLLVSQKSAERLTVALQERVEKMKDRPAGVLEMAREGDWVGAHEVAEFLERTSPDVPEHQGLAEKVRTVIREMALQELAVVEELIREQQYDRARQHLSALLNKSTVLASEEPSFGDLKETVRQADADFSEECWEALESSVREAHTAAMADELIENYLSWKEATHRKEAERLRAEMASKSKEYWVERHVEAARRAMAARNWPQVEAILDSGESMLSGGDVGSAQKWRQQFAGLRREVNSIIRPATASAVRQVMTLTGHADMVKSVAFSRDGRWLATGGLDGAVLLWSPPSWRQEGMLLRPERTGVRPIALSPDSRLLAAGYEDGRVVLWDVERKVIQRVLPGHQRRTTSVAFSADGSLLASATADEVKFWDVQKGTEVALLPDAALKMQAVFSPSQPLLAGRNEEGDIELWDFVFRTRLRVLSVRGKALRVAFSPDGKLIAASDDNTICVWDVSTGLIRTLPGHSEAVWALAFSPDHRILASGSVDRTIRLWDLETGSLLATLNGHDRQVYAVDFSPDGRVLASGSNDKTVKIWAVVQSSTGQTEPP